MILVCFATLSLGFGALIAMPAEANFFVVGIGLVAVSFAAFFGLRGVYFALFEESGLPDDLTGTAVGLVSVIGFTPEIFMPLVIGHLVQSARDTGDVMVGYQWLFALVAGVAFVGLVAAWLLQRLNRSDTEPRP